MRKKILLLTHRYEVEILGEERSVARNILIISRAGHRRCRNRNYVHLETQCCDWEAAPCSHSTFISRRRSGNAAAVLVVEFFRC